MKPQLTAKRIIGIIIILLLLLIARPVIYLTYVFFNAPSKKEQVDSGTANDASGLNKTRIAETVRPSENIDSAIAQIAQLVQQAAEQNKKISITGAQHSMGGHTIYRDAIVLDMKTLHGMKFDSARNILWVGAGALWSEVLPYLDKIGKSVAVMQSNNSFSVGGSISVNCHGWQPNAAPIAATVESFPLINAQGQVLRCSRTENKELFSLVLGGYGLFGVITDVELRVANNELYSAHQYVIDSKDYIDQFQQLVTADPTVGLAYGRININPNNFLEEAILSTFKIDTTSVLPEIKRNALPALRRTVFRGSVNSSYGKNLRWKIEKASASLIDGKQFTRNYLSNEGVEIYQNNNPNYTDILHEYFIPKNAVSQFIDSLKAIIPNYRADLLNITVRNVKKDNDVFLAYAKEEVFGFVMLFNQSKDSSAEVGMRKLTQRLVSVAINLKGTYYLPYRLHASREQMRQAYPMADSFFLLKRKYDPKEVFTNNFYATYK